MARPKGPWAAGRLGSSGHTARALAAGAGLSAGLLLSTLVLAAPAMAVGNPTSAPAPPPSCGIVWASTVRAVLGAPAGPPVETHPVPSGTTCTFAVGDNSLGVQLTFLAVPLSAFQTVEGDYLRTGATKVYGIGQAAFALSSANGTYENLFFYDSGYNMGITAQAPLPRLEDLVLRQATLAP